MRFKDLQTKFSGKTEYLFYNFIRDAPTMGDHQQRHHREDQQLRQLQPQNVPITQDHHQRDQQ